MTRRAAATMVGLLLAALLVAGGWKLYRHLYFHHTPAYRASEPLFHAARLNRSLTPVEFAQALQLADCGEPIVELRMWAALDVAAAAEPAYRPQLLAFYTRRAADPRLQALAAKKAAALGGPP